VFWLLAACGTEPSPPPPVESEVWATGWFSAAVARHDDDGDEIGRLADVNGPQAIIPWGDGALVVAEQDGQILRIDVDGERTVWADGLDAPTGVVALPDGSLAVGSFEEDRVMRYDADGLFVEDIVTGCDGPDAGLSVDDEGRLWVPCFDANEVLVLDGGSVAMTLRMSRPRVIRHDPAGTAWISVWGTGQLRRYGPDGTEQEEFVVRRGITGLAFDGPDVWVANDRAPVIERFDRLTGEPNGTIEANLDGVTFVAVLTPGE